MLTDNIKNKKRTVPRRNINAVKKRWSDSQKLEAVTTFLMLGSVKLTASVLKIPEITVKTWKASDWWKETVNELKVQDELLLSTKLKKIVDKSLTIVEDRLENGDYVYDQKSGGIRRKPVSLRDTHKVLMDLSDKREHLLDKNIDNGSNALAEDKLQKLAEKFAALVQDQRKPIIEVTDVITVQENIDAVYEERET
jgi:hypothetical protein